MKNKYRVTFSYGYEIEAEGSEEAEALAVELFDEEAPLSDEMNINIENISSGEPITDKDVIRNEDGDEIEQ